MSKKNVVVAVIGAGPAGLMAAETLVREGMTVQVYEAKPSVGRKFLMAGRGGLNITHSESLDKFVTRYGARAAEIGRMLEQFDAEALRAWVHALGIETFVGSSGRVFPHEMKAAPLLRAWMHRLRIQGVQFLMRHRWLGWDDTQQLRFETPRGEITTTPDATVLALGGGSWARLGSDGAWWPWLKELGVPLSPLLPTNGGFETTWSAHFLEKCAGEPIKTVAFRIEGSKAAPLRGECVVTQHGLEGGAIYALSAALRDRILSRGNVTLLLDLLPDHSPQRVLDEVSRARGTRSMSSHLRTRLGLQGVRAALLRERLSVEVFNDPQKLAFGIKNLPIVLSACRPIDEAISTAGGVQFEGMTEHGMLKNLPGVFCAGEMLDWEAPTGGYLLNGVMASGQATAKGLLAWLESRP
jgi:uncharacterized flavoprotein (TIGR03862 family)